MNTLVAYNINNKRWTVIREGVQIIIVSYIKKIPSRPSAVGGVVVAVVIVYQAEFGVVVFAAPLDGLSEFGGVRGGAYGAIGGVGVGGAYASGGGVEFAEILHRCVFIFYFPRELDIA